MADIVIVAYRPKPGQAEALLALTVEHVPTLRRLGLATDRPAMVMTNKDGVIVEVFEWADGGMAKAHETPEVQEMWARYDAACDYIPLRELPEAAEMFAEFKPVSV